MVFTLTARTRDDAMTRMNGHRPGIYTYDAADRVLAVNEEGVRLEGENGIVAGGGMFDWPSDDRRPASVVVLVAPSMPRRFKALEITEGGTFLIRTDDVRCEVNCDPLMAESLATRDTIMVTEASGQPNGANESYEVMVYDGAAPTMRM